MEAARAVECSDRQGESARYVHYLFRSQTTFAQRPWIAVAGEARIKLGVEVASDRAIIGTPGFWVNGERSAPPSLRADVERSLKRNGR